MKKKPFFITLIILSFNLLGMLSLAACVPIKTTQTHTFNDIQAGNQSIVSVILKEDDRLDLSVSVQSYDIGIMVEGPSGQATLPYSRVDTANFYVIADEDGVYKVILDNTYSVLNSKNVTLIMKYPER